MNMRIHTLIFVFVRLYLMRKRKLQGLQQQLYVSEAFSVTGDDKHSRVAGEISHHAAGLLAACQLAAWSIRPQ